MDGYGGGWGGGGGRGAGRNGKTESNHNQSICAFFVFNVTLFIHLHGSEIEIVSSPLYLSLSSLFSLFLSFLSPPPPFFFSHLLPLSSRREELV